MTLTVTKFFFGSVFLTLMLMAGVVTAAEDRSFGIRKAAETSGLAENQLSQSGEIPEVLGMIVGAVLSLVGIFFFILILIAGFEWMTAQGSAEKVDSAKKRLVAAFIGLIIVLSAYIISNFIFSRFLGSSGPSAEVTENTCQNAANGTACGENMACQDNNCIEECRYRYPDSGQCGSDCQESSVPGLCPNNAECCVNDAEYYTTFAPGEEL